MSLNIKVTNQLGEELHEITLDEAVFGIEPHQQAMFDAVVKEQASYRQGNASTKGRSEVSGTGKKSVRQKGTGGARHHSRRAPQFVGGGVVFGPKPRSYKYRINRKVARLALRSYLSTFAESGNLKVVDKIEMDQIKTKDFVQIMKNLGVDRKVLFVFDDTEDIENAVYSMNNLQNAYWEYADGISCLELANSYTLVCTEKAIETIQEGLR